MDNNVLSNVWMLVRFTKKISVPSKIINGEIIENHEFMRTEIVSGSFDHVMPEILDYVNDGYLFEIRESRLQ